MQRISTIKFDENGTAKDVTIKEFSVAQINDLMENIGDIKRCFIDFLFQDRADRLPAEIVAKSTGLTMDELEMFSPTKLEQIYDEVERLNPFFFRLIDRLSEYSKEISIEKPSTPPAVG